MMTKIAHMRENRKANKGFSLVELIIVMAIMVALVAVLAPQYIRYLQRSRDAVVKNAAEDVLTAVKTDLIDPDGELEVDSSGSATVIVKAAPGGAAVTATSTHLNVKAGATASTADGAIATLAGIGSKPVKSNVQVTITINYNGGNYTFSSSEGTITA